MPLAKRALQILEQRRKDGPSGPEDLVFPNRGGAPYDRMDRAPEAAGKGYFADAAASAGLAGKVTFHSLRHVFAVRLLTSGEPITVVSELLGHSDINLTVKRYGRFSSDARVKWQAVEALDRFPGRASAPPAAEPVGTSAPASEEDMGAAVARAFRVITRAEENRRSSAGAAGRQSA